MRTDTCTGFYPDAALLWITLKVPIYFCCTSIWPKTAGERAELFKTARSVWNKTVDSNDWYVFDEKAKRNRYLKIHFELVFRERSFAQFSPITDNVVGPADKPVINGSGPHNAWVGYPLDSTLASIYEDMGLSASGQIMNVVYKKIPKGDIGITFAHEVGHLLFHPDWYDVDSPFLKKIADWVPDQNIMYNNAPRINYQNIQAIISANSELSE